MAQRRLHLETPPGTRDLLFDEAEIKREIENRMSAAFRRWAYREVLTPTLEYYDTLLRGAAQSKDKEIYKFVDREGYILALRPELTTPLARVSQTRLAGQERPLRLFYFGPVFRYAQPQSGRPREFFQTGAELIGGAGAAADAEILALAIEILETAGLRDFQVGLGQVEVMRSLYDKLPLAAEEKEDLLEALGRKDLVAVEQIIAQKGQGQSQARLLTALLELHGGKETLEQARSLAEGTEAVPALESLELVWDLVQSYGKSPRLFLDLGILRDFNYYTGLVFEVYVPGLGIPLGGGGRYDHLLEQFGEPCPATGFALNLDLIIQALLRQEEGRAGGRGKIGLSAEAGSPQYLVAGSDWSQVVAYARRLRQKGFRVEVDLAGLGSEEVQEYARRRGIDQVIFLGDRGGR